MQPVKKRNKGKTTLSKLLRQTLILKFKKMQFRVAVEHLCMAMNK